MNRNRNKPRVICLIVLLSVVMLGYLLVLVAYGERRNGVDLGNGYQLWKSNEGMFLVNLGPDDSSSGGVFDGGVERIGQTDGVVVCYVDRSWNNDPDGWYWLNTTSGEVKGPILESELESFAKIKASSCVAVFDFWKRKM